MQEVQNIKVNYYFDEAGDTSILGHHGVLLQASDYVLWTIQRAYEKGDYRYYNFLKEKINLIHDIFDFEKYPKNYYSPKNPLEAKKIDPV